MIEQSALDCRWDFLPVINAMFDGPWKNWCQDFCTILSIIFLNPTCQLATKCLSFFLKVFVRLQDSVKACFIQMKLSKQSVNLNYLANITQSRIHLDLLTKVLFFWIKKQINQARITQGILYSWLKSEYKYSDSKYLEVQEK